MLRIGFMKALLQRVAGAGVAVDGRIAGERQRLAGENMSMRPYRWAAVLSMSLILVLLSGCSSLFFFPSRVMVDNPGVRFFQPEDVYFKNALGLSLHGWFFRAKEAQGSVLFLHGNAENISTHVNSVLWLTQAGFNVFAFDYRGYGLSAGKPSLEGVHEDAEAALETLLTLPGVERNKIIVLGQSIGGAIAVYLSATTPHKSSMRALIVDSSFSSYRLIAREKMNQLWLTWPLQYPLSWLFDDSYSPVGKMPMVAPVPVLIMHGMRDEVVPMHHGAILFEAARGEKEFWITASEGHIVSMREPAVRERLREYLRARVKEKESAAPGI